MSETNNETAVRSRTTSTTSPSKAKLTPLVPGKEDPNRPLVELTHVEKHFGALHVLKDINLTVTKGEVLVVVGPSGSGKSTMCRTINRLETIDSGDIRIDGKPLPQEGKELANLRAEVGMVFQSFNLFANKTILENVTLALIKVRHMDKKEAEQLAMDLLARVGVDSQASKMPSQLSGGQQQRVALARILVGDPELILLDEPFSALDGHLRWEFEMMLADTLRAFPGGAVFVSHNRDEVYRLCDTVCVVSEGRSEEKLTIAQLFSTPRTLAAALISGCKNVSRARVAPGEGEDAATLECADWGVALKTTLPVGPDVTHAGLRAHYLRVFADPTAAVGLPNQIPCVVDRVIDSTFSTIVMLRTPGGGLLRYECEKDAWAPPSGARELVVAADPSIVMPLAGGGADA